MTFKKIINNSKDHLDFWSRLEKAGGRLLFEELVAYYLKATLPGETYWLGEDVIPPSIAEEYRFSNILKGKRSLGSDIINIHQNRATAYESKWFDHKQSINLKLVANKLQVISKTGIDQLIFTTNARRPSDMVTEWAGEVGFLFQECWMRKEVFDIVKTFINKQTKKVYRALQPRDNFFQSALDKLKTDFDSKFLGISYADILTRIFQHWPAASGKGSFPRLAYDIIFEPRWDFKKGYPINLILNPTLAVLKTNFVKHLEHDLALGNDVVHVIFASDISGGAKNTEELQNIRALGKVFTSKIEFVDFVRKTKNKTIWVHSTVHSYSRDKNGLAQLMKPLKRHFFFGHLDEVHHMIQPDYSSWVDGLDDDVCKIQIRIMTSANKRIAKGNGSTYSMGDRSFSDIQVKDLDEKTAVRLGYKRDCELINYIYGTEDFPVDWFDTLEKGGQPLLKHKGSKMVVPMNWYMAVDSLLRFRTEYSQTRHTKLTLNTINECVNFKKFFDSIKKDILLKLCGSKDNEVYKRLIKAKVMVSDTHSHSTIKILKEVEAIPDRYEDSFLIHCRLLGEGWDPENGWIDSTMFVSPIWSEIRIYQDYNRGSRIGDGSKKTNYLLMCHLKDEDQVNKGNETRVSQFNNMFGTIKHIANVLEIGIEDVKEKVIFKEFKKVPKNKGAPRSTGSDEWSYQDMVDSGFFTDAFDKYVKHGRYYVYGSLIHQMIDDYQKEFEKRHLENTGFGGVPAYQRRHYLMYEIMIKNKEFFDQYAKGGRVKKMEDFIKGKDSRVSADTVVEISEWKDKVEETNKTRKEKLKAHLETILDADHYEVEDALMKFYHETFGKPKEVNPITMKGYEPYFGLVYGFDEDDMVGDGWKMQINQYDLEEDSNYEAGIV